MRPITIAGVLLALPLITAAPAVAQNDVLNQAQRFLNPNGDREAYERGRQDQARQEQYRRDQRRAARQYDDQRYSRQYSDPYYDR